MSSTLPSPAEHSASVASTSSHRRPEPSPADPGAAAGRSPVREVLANRWLQVFAIIWAAAVAYILLSDRSVLPQSDQEPLAYFSGIAGAAASLALLFRLARGTTPIGVGHGPTFRNARMETAGLLAWMALVVAVGSLFDIRTHIAFVGLSEGAQSIWDGEDARSTLLWAAYNFLALAVLPFLFFRYHLGYNAASMLLRFPRPAVWGPYFLVIGVLGFVFAITPAFTQIPWTAQLATLLLFTVGSFLPIMIVTQSLLTPRLATLAGSWVTGAVVSAVAYGALNITEAILVWGSPQQITRSIGSPLPGILMLLVLGGLVLLLSAGRSSSPGAGSGPATACEEPGRVGTPTTGGLIWYGSTQSPRALHDLGRRLSLD